MNWNTGFKTIVMVLVVVLLAATCIIPVVTSAQSEQVSQDNNTDLKYKASMATDSETYEIEMLNEGLAVNGELITGIGLSSTTYQVVFSDSFTSNYYGSTKTLRVTIFNSSSQINLAVGSKLILDNGVASSIVNDVTTELITYSIAFLPDNAGDVALATASNGTVYINADTQIYTVVNASYINSSWINGIAILTVTKDGLKSMLCSYYDSDEGEMKQFTDTTGITATLNGLEEVDDITWKFNGHVDIVTTVSTVSNNAFTYYPIEYDYLTDNESMYRVMFGLIPIMLLILPIFILIRAFSNRSD